VTPLAALSLLALGTLAGLVLGGALGSVKRADLERELAELKRAHAREVSDTARVSFRVGHIAGTANERNERAKVAAARVALLFKAVP
jgi:hypothetical protein